MRPVHGDPALFATLQRHVLTASPGSKVFLAHLAKQATRQRAAARVLPRLRAREGRRPQGHPRHQARRHRCRRRARPGARPVGRQPGGQHPGPDRGGPRGRHPRRRAGRRPARRVRVHLLRAAAPPGRPGARGASRPTTSSRPTTCRASTSGTCARRSRSCGRPSRRSPTATPCSTSREPVPPHRPSSGGERALRRAAARAAARLPRGAAARTSTPRWPTCGCSPSTSRPPASTRAATACSRSAGCPSTVAGSCSAGPGGWWCATRAARRRRAERHRARAHRRPARRGRPARGCRGAAARRRSPGGCCSPTSRGSRPSSSRRCASGPGAPGCRVSSSTPSSSSGARWPEAGGASRQAGALRLWTARERRGLPVYRAHEALTDALACAELYLAQRAELAARRPETTLTLRHVVA